MVPEPWASMYDPAEMPIGKLTPGEHDANPEHFRRTQYVVLLTAEPTRIAT